MRVAHLSLADFRNYSRADVELGSGSTVIAGRNGQGKTNLVEAIGYLSTLSSHRVSTDAALIRAAADSAVIRARLENGDRQLLVELQLNRGAPNRAQLNRGAVKPRELTRHLSTVVFAPEDLALVRAEPGGRRRFLDELLAQKSPRFAGIFSDYERVVRQRNSLLKSARASRVPPSRLTTLEVWDERLVELGSEIITARLALVDELREPVATAYRSVAGGEHDAILTSRLSILGAQPDDETVPQLGETTSSADGAAIRDGFRSALLRERRAELDRGLTLVGPHRDDLVLTLNGLPARGYASHGESWSYALALKLASAEVLRRESPTGDPILILDDVFAELDEGRRERLASAIVDFEQVLITVAVENDIPDVMRGATIRIRGGTIVEDGEAT